MRRIRAAADFTGAWGVRRIRAAADFTGEW